jgi:hypothetical protein
MTLPAIAGGEGMRQWFISRDVTTVMGPSKGDVDVPNRLAVADRSPRDMARYLTGRRLTLKVSPRTPPNRPEWPVSALGSVDLCQQTHTPLSERGGQR